MSMETEKQAGGGAGATRDPDEFSSLLKQSFRTKDERAATEVENAIQTLVNQALTGAEIIPDDVYATLDAMIAELDRKLSLQVNEILHAPEFQQIESAWRGLHYLVFNSETDAMLKIKVMNIGKRELGSSFRTFSGAKWDQHPLFKKVYEQEYGTLGGQPMATLVADYYFNHTQPDIDLMRNLSKIAASAHCPLIAGAAPSLMGMDSWTEIMDKRDLSVVFDTPEYGPWKSLRDAEDSRYLGLCLPRVLSRVPYGANSDPIDEFAFEEETDGHDGEKYAWMNASYAMATNITRAFKEYGWCVRIRGVQSGGEVVNLPTHTFKTDDGGVDMKCPTEISITDRREAELSKAGLIPLIHRKNTDKAAFIGAQSVYAPKRKMDKATGKTEDATASENLSARLPYIFAISRFAHYLKCMVRDKIGSTMEEKQLQRWLQDWITLYVDGDPKNSSETTKAKQPLADASVQVIPDPENPGQYAAKILLRPHFQLEGMDIGMSLVARLPKQGG